MNTIRRSVLVLMLVFATVFSVSAQETISSPQVIRDSFSTFAQTFSDTLPLNSAIGLNWSDAYIGQLFPIPSFGVGLTTGVTVIPVSAFNQLRDDLGLDASDAFGRLPGVGLPLPGWVVDARLGGIGLPFDIGLKFGGMPSVDLGGFTAEYRSLGFDARYAVLEGGLILPKVSLGIGFNYLTGGVGLPLRTGPLEVTRQGGNYTLDNPALDLNWSARHFDVKGEISKGFVIVEPHLGIGVSYGTTETTMGFRGNSTDAAGTTDGVRFTENGITVTQENTGATTRVFGGVKLNLAIFKLDFGVIHGLGTGIWGGTVGARVQL